MNPDTGLDTATYEDKLAIIEMLDVRGTIAVENNQKVVYIKCILEQPQRLPMLISPWHCYEALVLQMLLKADAGLQDISQKPLLYS